MRRFLPLVLLAPLAALQPAHAFGGYCYYRVAYFNPNFMNCEEVGDAPGYSMKKIFLCCN